MAPLRSGALAVPAEIDPRVLREDEGHVLWVAGRVKTLLANWWDRHDPPEMRHAVALDWVDVIGGLPKAAITDAVRTFLRDETRRPTPADIHRRALAWMARERSRASRESANTHPPFPIEGMTFEEAAASRERVQEIIHRAGMAVAAPMRASSADDGHA